MMLYFFNKEMWSSNSYECYTRFIYHILNVNWRRYEKEKKITTYWNYASQTRALLQIGYEIEPLEVHLVQNILPFHTGCTE